MLFIAVELGNLDRSRADRRPAGVLSANTFVAARLINEYELVGLKLRDLVKVIALEICVLFLCYLLGRLLRLLDRLQRPTYTCLRYFNTKPLTHKTSYLVLI
jgi:hypothetical protein